MMCVYSVFQCCCLHDDSLNSLLNHRNTFYRYESRLLRSSLGVITQLEIDNAILNMAENVLLCPPDV